MNPPSQGFGGMKSPTYTLSGPPVPQPRPRFTHKGFTYDPATIFKEHSRKELIAQRLAGLVINTPISLCATFFMPIPNSLTKKKKTLLISQPHHSKKPDLDNLLKYLLDCISKNVLIFDDSLIHTIYSKKLYDSDPRTEFYFVYGESDNE